MIAARVPIKRPRKYQIGPAHEAVTVTMLNEMRAEAANAPEDIRDGLIAIYNKLESHGWCEISGGGRLFMTGDGVRAIEADAEKQLREHHHEEELPGFYAEWERTVGVYTYADGESELHPVITLFAINPAESHEAAAERYIAVAQEHGRVVGRLS